MRLFLLLSEALSSGFVPVCEPAEMSARWCTGLLITILTALHFHQFVPSNFFVVMTNLTYVYKHVWIWFKHNIVYLIKIWLCLYHRMLGYFTWPACLKICNSSFPPCHEYCFLTELFKWFECVVLAQDPERQVGTTVLGWPDCSARRRGYITFPSWSNHTVFGW